MLFVNTCCIVSPKLGMRPTRILGKKPCLRQMAFLLAHVDLGIEAELDPERRLRFCRLMPKPHTFFLPFPFLGCIGSFCYAEKLAG